MQVVESLSTLRSFSSFSRASIATYRDRNGNFIIASSNQLRANYKLKPSQSNVDYFIGFLVEPSRTNYLRNTASSQAVGLATPLQLNSQTVNLGSVNQGFNSYLTLSFFGTGTVTVTGGGLTYSLTGTANNTSDYPSYITFPTPATSLSIQVQGTVYAANLENCPLQNAFETDPVVLTASTRPTSWIPTLNASFTREGDIVASGILYSSFADNTPEWDNTVTYQTGTPHRVRYNNVIYQSIVDNNLGNNPETTSGKWSKVSTSNDFAMLDLEEGSTSVSPEIASDGAYFSYCFKDVNLSNVNSVLVGVGASTSELTTSIVTNAGCFNYSKILENNETVNYNLDNNASVFSSSNIQVQAVVVSFRVHNGINPADGEMLQQGTSTSVTEIVVGSSEFIGKTQYGVRVGIVDYSIKETNEFGVTFFNKRGFSKTLSCSVFVEKTDYNRVTNLLFNLRATPCIWIATDDSDYAAGSVVFGTYNDFDITISYPTVEMLSIEIEGLVI